MVGIVTPQFSKSLHQCPWKIKDENKTYKPNKPESTKQIFNKAMLTLNISSYDAVKTEEANKMFRAELLCFQVGSGVLWEWELPLLLWAVSTGVSSELPPEPGAADLHPQLRAGGIYGCLIRLLQMFSFGLV